MNQTPQLKNVRYPVSLWEIAAVFLSAIALITTGTIGLGLKFTNNAFKPDRAKLFADNIIDYQFPRRSQGVLGFKIAGAEVALISDGNKKPDLQLFAARIINDNQMNEDDINQVLDGAFLGEEDNFVVNSSRLENKNLCKLPTAIAIKEGQLQRTTTDSSASKFAVTYKGSVVVERHRYFVAILSNGKNAREDAANLFNSLQCKSRNR
jgi:hypothetical protein